VLGIVSVFLLLKPDILGLVGRIQLHLFNIADLLKRIPQLRLLQALRTVLDADNTVITEVRLDVVGVGVVSVSVRVIRVSVLVLADVEAVAVAVPISVGVIVDP